MPGSREAVSTAGELRAPNSGISGGLFTLMKRYAARSLHSVVGCETRTTDTARRWLSRLMKNSSRDRRRQSVTARVPGPRIPVGVTRLTGGKTQAGGQSHGQSCWLSRHTILRHERSAPISEEELRMLERTRSCGGACHPKAAAPRPSSLETTRAGPGAGAPSCRLARRTSRQAEQQSTP